MNYQALSDFRATCTDDNDCLTKINAIVPTGKTRVALGDLNYYLFATGIFGAIQTATATNPVAAQAYAYLNMPSMSVLDFNDPVAGTLIPALVAYGIASQSQVDAAKLSLGVMAPQYVVSGIFEPNETKRTVTQDDLTQAVLVSQWQTLADYWQSVAAGIIGPGINNSMGGNANGPVPTATSLTIGH